MLFMLSSVPRVLLKCNQTRLYCHCNHLQVTRRTRQLKKNVPLSTLRYLPNNKTCCKTKLTFSLQHCPFTQIHTLLHEASGEFLLIRLSLEVLRASDLPTCSTAKTYNLHLHIHKIIHPIPFNDS